MNIPLHYKRKYIVQFPIWYNIKHKQRLTSHFPRGSTDLQKDIKLFTHIHSFCCLLIKRKLRESLIVLTYCNELLFCYFYNCGIFLSIVTFFTL